MGVANVAVIRSPQQGAACGRVGMKCLRGEQQMETCQAPIAHSFAHIAPVFTFLPLDLRSQLPARPPSSLHLYDKSLLLLKSTCIMHATNSSFLPPKQLVLLPSCRIAGALLITFLAFPRRIGIPLPEVTS